MEIKLSSFKEIFTVSAKFPKSYKILAVIFLSLLCLAYVGVVFYRYAWNLNSPAASLSSQSVIDKALYEKMLGEFKKRDTNFSQEQHKSYINPFK